MAITPNEKAIRRVLPVLRLMLAYMPVPVMRWLERRGDVRAVMRPDIRREQVMADGVRCEWLIPQNANSDQVLLYLHGGGFVYGWTDAHRQMVSYLAKLMGMRVLAVDYRLAPEHPFPAALEDCSAAYRWLLKQGFAARNVVVAGDSAGGQLTLSTLLHLRDNGDPLPAAAACLSPAADLTDRDDEAYHFYDAILHPRAANFFRNAYVAQHDPRDPLISPVFADWHGLPPLLIYAGEEEFLRDDSARVAELAQQAGVDVRLEIEPRMWHVWQLTLSLPQATQSLDDIGQFLKSHLGVTETSKLPVNGQAVSNS